MQWIKGHTWPLSCSLGDQTHFQGQELLTGLFNPQGEVGNLREVYGNGFGIRTWLDKSFARWNKTDGGWFVNRVNSGVRGARRLCKWRGKKMLGIMWNSKITAGILESFARSDNLCVLESHCPPSSLITSVTQQFNKLSLSLLNCWVTCSRKLKCRTSLQVA